MMLRDYEVVPYRRLLCAVVLKAIEDYQDVLRQDGIQAAEASRVGRWFLTPAVEFGNFRHLCDLLGREPDRLLSRLNTRDLLKEMRALQAGLDAQYARYRAMVDGLTTSME